MLKKLHHPVLRKGVRPTTGTCLFFDLFPYASGTSLAVVPDISSHVPAAYGPSLCGRPILEAPLRTLIFLHNGGEF